MLAAALAASVTASAPAMASDRDKDDRAEPLVIGHRGASGYRPEHTLASYALAARMGADFVEPDLVITKDGVLVARHEPEIEDTTDVDTHPEFASRRTTKVIDGVSYEGFFVEDFTLAELKTLRAEERIPALRQRNTIYNGRFPIPTLQEVIDLTRRLSKELDREIGIYPETKHPTYFRSIGKPLEEPLVKALRKNGLDRRKAKIFVQSFEVDNLKWLNKKIDSPLVQLLSSGSPADGSGKTYAEMATAKGLKDVAKYAQGVGPSKDYIVPRVANSEQAPTSFIRDAHRAGLKVHPYTFRNENQFQSAEKQNPGTPADYGKAFDEYFQFFELGVDGVFSDNPDTAVAAREDPFKE